MSTNEHSDLLLLQFNKELTAAEKQDAKSQLIVYINSLLLHDFAKLVHILYRVDVDERKLKELLQENPGTDAAEIIADLLVKRQEEKLKTRAAFKPDNHIPDNEKW